ncbi:hypothetical protein KM043_015373 [Ampulex compressa]|nr:hypothetical protein KM043_015373 [Ampulex compressa]
MYNGEERNRGNVSLVIKVIIAYLMTQLIKAAPIKEENVNALHGPRPLLEAELELRGREKEEPGPPVHGWVKNARSLAVASNWNTILTLKPKIGEYSRPRSSPPLDESAREEEEEEEEGEKIKQPAGGPTSRFESR